MFCRWDPDSVDDPDGFGNTIGGFSKAHSFGVGSPKGGEVDGEAEEDLFEEGRKSKKTKSSLSHPPLVLIDATRAASPPEAPVWDLIEVTVAPFDLHLERETYGSFIKYAFPEKKKDGQKMSDEMTANHAAFELGLQALRGRTVPISREKEKDTSDLKLEAVDWTLGLKGDGSGGLTGDDPAAKGGASSDEPAKEKSHSEEQARLLLLGAPLRAKHARAKTWGADFFLNHKRGETETGTGVPTASPKEFRYVLGRSQNSASLFCRLSAPNYSRTSRKTETFFLRAQHAHQAPTRSERRRDGWRRRRRETGYHAWRPRA